MDGMAKVFKAGTISVGGDQIRLTSKGTDEFAFTDSSGSDLFSTAIYDSEVSSLAYHQNLDTVQRSSDISSLDIVKDSEVSSLQAESTERSSEISSLDIVKDSEVSSLAKEQDEDTLQRSSDISSLDIVKDSEVSSLAKEQDEDTLQRSSDISSLDIVKDSEVSSLAKEQDEDTAQRASDISSLDIVKDSEVSSLAKEQDEDTLQRSSDISSLDIVKDSEVSSLDSAISALDNALQVATVDVSNSVNTQTFTWEALFGANSGFSATTKVMVMVKAAQGADLIACQMAGIDGTGFTVDFSEGTGTGDAYDLIVMASN